MSSKPVKQGIVTLKATGITTLVVGSALLAVDRIVDGDVTCNLSFLVLVYGHTCMHTTTTCSFVARATTRLGFIKLRDWRLYILRKRGSAEVWKRHDSLLACLCQLSQ